MTKDDGYKARKEKYGARAMKKRREERAKLPKNLYSEQLRDAHHGISDEVSKLKKLREVRRHIVPKVESIAPLANSKTLHKGDRDEARQKLAVLKMDLFDVDNDIKMGIDNFWQKKSDLRDSGLIWLNRERNEEIYGEGRGGEKRVRKIQENGMMARVAMTNRFNALGLRYSPENGVVDLGLP
jgi:hypothetical protein